MNYTLSLDNVNIDKIDNMSIEFLERYEKLDATLHSKSSEIHLKRLCVKYNLSEHETNWALLWYRETYKNRKNQPSI
jgi:hypothetical protein